MILRPGDALRRLALALAALALHLPAAQAAPRVDTFELANGLRGVVIEDRRAPVVTHMVWYRVGAADEPPGKTGLAHFLEHLMFKGTDEIPDAEFSKIIAANGGQDNAFTAQDYTGYFQRIAADRLDLVMKMEADRMRDLRLNETQVATERDVILEERAQRVDVNPGALMSEQRTAAMFLNHPYGLPLAGWRHEMEQLDLQDALDFYAAYYAPNNAILVVAGDVSVDEVRALAEIHYGPLDPSDALPERVRPMEPPQRVARRLVYEDPRVRQEVVIRDYLAPVRRDGQDAAAALSALAGVLGDGLNSVLTRKLVIEQGLAIQAGAFYSGAPRDYGRLSVYAAPRPEVSLEAVEAALDEALAEFLAGEGPEPERLERFKTQWRASYIYAQDSQQSLARRYGAGLASDLTLEQIEAWPEVLQAVTIDDLMQAGRDVLRPERSVTGWLRAPEEGEG